MEALDTFKSEDAKHYWCQVEAYTSSHSMLLLRINFESYGGYLQFSFVQFFNGPMLWQGIDFQIAPPEMTVQFARNHSGLDHVKDDHILEMYKLYYLEKPRLQVQIIAAKVEQGDFRPEYPKRKFIND